MNKAYNRFLFTRVTGPAVWGGLSRSEFEMGPSSCLWSELSVM